MAQVLRRPHLPHAPRLTLNTDGQAHPRENTLAAVTALLGAVALGCGFAPSLHQIGSWTGVVGVVTGLYGQLVSATTAERAVLVVFLGGAAVGWGLSLAHGGFL